MFRAGIHLLVTDIECAEFAQNRRDLWRFRPIFLVSDQSSLVADISLFSACFLDYAVCEHGEYCHSIQ